MDYIKIDNDDNWDNKVWLVLEYHNNPNSTAVTLVLEDTNTKEVTHRVVASHQIEWLEAKDW
jgi:hypothetical protein